MRRIYGIDFRSLALFRQAIALLYIFLACVVRFMYFEYYSVEHGPFRNEVMTKILNRPILCDIIHTDIGISIAFALALVLGILLFFEVFPSLVSFAALILFSLISRRFFPYFYGTDEVLVCILFCLGFIYMLKHHANKSNPILSLKEYPFILLLLVQITIIYWFNGLNKTHETWWQGEAVSMAAFNMLFNKPLALQALKFHGINVFLTYLTLFFELLFPFLIFYPSKNGKIRFIAGILIVVFHWGIDLLADVTLYKYAGIAFFFLFIPSYMWDRFPKMERILIRSGKRMQVEVPTYFKKLAYILILVLSFKAVNASLQKQNLRYGFIKNKEVIEFMESCLSYSYSPFRQYWFMFAPSPPVNTGYIGFDYVESNSIDNINIYGNNMPQKNFMYVHPFHMCCIIQYNSIEKGGMPQENEFVLTHLFDYFVNKNIRQHPERKMENYQLVLYKQSYEDFKRSKKYNLERIIIGSYK